MHRTCVTPVHWWVWRQTCLCFIVLLMSWLCFCSGSAGYCFVELADESSVERCVQRLNGKLVPGSNPVSSLMWLLHICSISSTQSLQRSKVVVIHLNYKIYLLLPVLPFDFFGAPVMLSLVVVKLKRTAAICLNQTIYKETIKITCWET